MQSSSPPRALLIGTLCGAGAALGWAAGFVAAKHGVEVGFSPADLALHRFVWPGLFLIPIIWRAGIADVGGIGWGGALILTILSGPVQAMIAYTGFTLVPLGHGTVIQPACAALFGLLLASLVLGEAITARRVIGAIAIVAGLMVLGIEALHTIGKSGVIGDLLFVTAGVFWAIFGTLLRRWQVPGLRAAAIVGFISVIFFAPAHALLSGYGNILRLGVWENVLQIVVQGALAGILPIFLFARAVILLGAGRAGTFTALVPGFSLLIGFLALGNVPTTAQFAGFLIVVFGFWLVMRRS